MDISKVSVCIPTYNFAHLLHDAIESVLKQTLDDFELLIVDNCSTDNTREVVSRYANRDRRIRYLVNETNIGAVNNWNKCLLEASGNYIKFVFADDLLLEVDTLAKMAKILDTDEQVSLVVSSRRILDEQLRTIGVDAAYSDDRKVSGTRFIARSLWERKNLLGEASAVMFRKRNAVRGFVAKYIALPDLEMWFHLLEQGHLYFISEPLCGIRRHSMQGTHTAMKDPCVLLDTKYLLEEYLDKNYINLGGLSRRIILYDRLYRIWKSYRKNRISREHFIDFMGEASLVSFYAWLPLYKASSPFQKLYSRITRYRN